MRKPLVIQEILRDDPWKVLVACILLNQTTGRQVLSVIYDLFDEFPDPIGMAHARDEDIVRIIRTLGLSTKRAKYLKEMSLNYLKGAWTIVQDLPGCGKYAADSYAIFVENRRDVDPEDKVLKLFLEWERQASNVT